MLKTSQQGIEITNRFFEALDILRANKAIRGVNTFAKRHGINQGNLATLKNDPTNRILKPEYIAYLVEDFHISADWILLGVGPMFRQFSF